MKRFTNPAGYLRKALAVTAFLLVSPVTDVFAAEEAQFVFMAPPAENSVRLYWLNRKTGQVGACHYESPKDKTQLGGTKCSPAGQGAGPLGPGRYDLKASNHKTEGGIFRVNIDTGDISVCWVREGQTVCTAPAR